MRQQPYYLQRLGLDERADERAIKRAYARELKLIDHETEIEQFQYLRQAYEAALQWSANRAPASSAAIESQTGDSKSPDFSQKTIPVMLAAKGEHARRSPPKSSPPADRHKAAAELFSEFLKRCKRLVSKGQVDNYLPWRTELLQFMERPELDNLGVRDSFEYQVAHLLAKGWKPGHEALFPAAVIVFDWKDDQRRLIRFGQVGYILDHAIIEAATFDQQSGLPHDTQKHVVGRLRDSKPPSTHELIKYLDIAEMLVQRFQSWMPVITNTGNLEQWRKLNKDVPGWRRRLSFKSSKSKVLTPLVLQSPKLHHSGVGGRIDWVPVFGSGWKIFAALMFFSVLARMIGSGTGPVLQHKESFSYADSGASSSKTAGPTDSGGFGQRIKHNIRYDVPKNLVENPAVEYELQLFDDGRISNVKKLKSSGLVGFDEAVLAAIHKTQPFPRDSPKNFILVWRPKDI